MSVLKSNVLPWQPGQRKETGINRNTQHDLHRRPTFQLSHANRHALAPGVLHMQWKWHQAPGIDQAFRMALTKTAWTAKQGGNPLP